MFNLNKQANNYINKHVWGTLFYYEYEDETILDNNSMVKIKSAWYHILLKPPGENTVSQSGCHA